MKNKEIKIMTSSWMRKKAIDVSKKYKWNSKMIIIMIIIDMKWGITKNNNLNEDIMMDKIESNG